MKLQRVLNRTRGTKTYEKWQVTLPPEVIAALGWTPGMELDAEAKAGKLVVQPSKPPSGRPGPK